MLWMAGREDLLMRVAVAAAKAVATMTAEEIITLKITLKTWKDSLNELFKVI